MTITFYAVIDTEAWNFDKESKIQLAFVHETLGKWDCSLGQFSILE